MPKTPYTEGPPSVNGETEFWPLPDMENQTDLRRREVLRSLDLITTEELLEGLRCSRKTLALLRQHGLEQLGAGKDRFYRRSSVASALEQQARSNPEGMEADGDE